MVKCGSPVESGQLNANIIHCVLLCVTSIISCIDGYIYADAEISHDGRHILDTSL